jgi:hypothetical protein
MDFLKAGMPRPLHSFLANCRPFGGGRPNGLFKGRGARGTSQTFSVVDSQPFWGEDRMDVLKAGM